MEENFTDEFRTVFEKLVLAHHPVYSEVEPSEDECKKIEILHDQVLPNWRKMTRKELAVHADAITLGLIDQCEIDQVRNYSEIRDREFYGRAEKVPSPVTDPNTAVLTGIYTVCNQAALYEHLGESEDKWEIFRKECSEGRVVIDGDMNSYLCGMNETEGFPVGQCPIHKELDVDDMGFTQEFQKIYADLNVKHSQFNGVGFSNACMKEWTLLNEQVLPNWRNMTLKELAAHADIITKGVVAGAKIDQVQKYSDLNDAEIYSHDEAEPVRVIRIIDICNRAAIYEHLGTSEEAWETFCKACSGDRLAIEDDDNDFICNTRFKESIDLGDFTEEFGELFKALVEEDFRVSFGVVACDSSSEAGGWKSLTRKELAIRADPFIVELLTSIDLDQAQKYADVRDKEFYAFLEVVTDSSKRVLLDLSKIYNQAAVYEHLGISDEKWEIFRKECSEGRAIVE